MELGGASGAGGQPSSSGRPAQLQKACRAPGNPGLGRLPARVRLAQLLKNLEPDFTPWRALCSGTEAVLRVCRGAGLPPPPPLSF